MPGAVDFHVERARDPFGSDTWRLPERDERQQSRGNESGGVWVKLTNQHAAGQTPNKKKGDGEGYSLAPLPFVGPGALSAVPAVHAVLAMHLPKAEPPICVL